MEIRKLFTEMVCILCISPRHHSYEVVKITEDGIPTTRLKAPTIEFNKCFKPNDPKELFIAMNDMIVYNFIVIPLVHRADVVGVGNTLMGVDLTPWDRNTWNIKDWTRGS
jgi:hypothetical protein